MTVLILALATLLTCSMFVARYLAKKELTLLGELDVDL